MAQGPRIPQGPKLPGAVRGDARAPRLDPIANALLKSGVVATPKEAQALARTLLAALRGKGVSATTLPATLKLFQKGAGLPQTGTLDAATQKALVEAGLLPAPKTGGKGEGGKVEGGAQSPPQGGAVEGRDTASGKSGAASSGKLTDVAKLAGEAPRQWGTVGGKKGEVRAPREGAQKSAPGEASHRVEISETAARNALMSPDDAPSLRDLLENLASLGFFGGGQGAKQLKDAVRKFQGKLGLPQTGKLDDKTKDALRERGLLDGGGREANANRESTGRGADGAGRKDGAGKGEGQSAANAPPTENARASEQMRRDSARADADPTSRGAPDGKPGHEAGRSATDGQAAGLRGEGGSGAGDVEGDGLVDAGDEEGAEGETGNSAAGDDDLEGDRGHATLDDESEDDEGFYEIPPLSEQIAAALESIARDDDGRGAATYAWDVTFYRPGVYGRRQPAEPLWHVGITGASPFDPVWATAQSVLADRLADIEPESAAPTDVDFERALRRARARSS